MKFDIESVEVWGCGGTQADLEQGHAKHRQERDIEARRKVNRQMANGGTDWTAV